MESKEAGQWIRDRRKLLGMRREDLTAPTHLALSTLARLEKGEGANRATVAAVAKALRLDPAASEALADWHTGKISRQDFLNRYNGGVGRSAEAFLKERGLQAGELPRRIQSSLPAVKWMVAQPGMGTPVLGEITAGGLVESIVFESGDEPERIPIYYPEANRVYALKIKGDSMAPEYRSGEVLICQDADPETLEDGEDAVVQCDGGMDGASTFKRCFFVGHGRVRLTALNSAFEPAECNVDSIVRLGRVLGVYKEKARRKRGN